MFSWFHKDRSKNYIVKVGQEFPFYSVRLRDTAVNSEPCTLLNLDYVK